MIHLESFLHELLVQALFDAASDPCKLMPTRIAARAVIAAHDAGPIGRALRHADASRAAPAKYTAQS